MRVYEPHRAGAMYIALAGRRYFGCGDIFLRGAGRKGAFERRSGRRCLLLSRPLPSLLKALTSCLQQIPDSLIAMLLSTLTFVTAVAGCAQAASILKRQSNSSSVPTLPANDPFYSPGVSTYSSLAPGSIIGGPAILKFRYTADVCNSLSIPTSRYNHFLVTD